MKEIASPPSSILYFNSKNLSNVHKVSVDTRIKKKINMNILIVLIVNRFHLKLMIQYFHKVFFNSLE